MKRANIPQIVLELIVILGYIILGVTILTYLFQREIITNILIGLIVLTIGVLGFAEFITLKMAAKLKSIQSMALSLVGVGFGITFVILKDVKTICLLWGVYTIALCVARIVTGVLNLSRQPLLSIVRMITSLAGITFGIFLIVRTIDFISVFFTYLGIALSVEAVILLIEFLIHRYQN